MKSWESFEDEVKKGCSKEEFERLEISANFAAVLINLRLNRNMTQHELAIRSGLKQSAVARIENNGSLPRIDTVYKLARALDCRVEFLPNDVSCSDETSETINLMQRQINKLETILQDLLAETKTITRRLDHESRQIVDKSNKYITLVMQNADSNYKIDYSSSKRLASLNSNLERMGGLI